MTDFTLLLPEKQLLGKKKQPASFPELKNWLFTAAAQADHLIVSIDMLVYGGIVPSRLHLLTVEECESRLHVLKELKEKHPSLQIYAFNLIMRTPSYNSDDEEPTYYASSGSDIFTYGWLTDKQTSDELTADEQQTLSAVEKRLPASVLTDFTNRRHMNATVNKKTVDYAADQVINFLIIPLDDNAQYGFSPKEQRKLVTHIEKKNLMDIVAVYPGADEAGCTLFAHVFCKEKQYEPEIYIKYSSTKGPSIIPALEDRSLNESVKAQIAAANGYLTDSEASADAILMIHSPGAGQTHMAGPEDFTERHPSYVSEINKREFVRTMKRFIDKGKTVGLADVAILNGSDHLLMQLLSKNNLLHELASYAGWNTSGNTLGTAIAQLIIQSYYGPSLQSRYNLLYRLVEDWGYQATVRQQVTQELLPTLDATYFDISAEQHSVEAQITERIKEFVTREFPPELLEGLTISRCTMPWTRMFEVELEIQLT